MTALCRVIGPLSVYGVTQHTRCKGPSLLRLLYLVVKSCLQSNKSYQPLACLVIGQQIRYQPQSIDVAMTEGDNPFKHVIDPDESLFTID